MVLWPFWGRGLENEVLQEVEIQTLFVETLVGRKEWEGVPYQHQSTAEGTLDAGMKTAATC